MNSGSEKKLSMDELLEKNRPAQMVQTTPQTPAQELTPPPEVHPTKAEWVELLSSLYTLGYHTERQTGYLKKVSELLAQLPPQTQMDELGYTNAFIGTVEGEPEETACEAVIDAVKEAGYKKVVLRPLMVVAGDHANNDMAGSEEDSWKSMFEESGNFDSVETQISGLGRIDAIQELFVEHTQAAIDSLGAADAEAETEETAE